METTSLINDILLTDSVYFRKVKLGDPMELVEQIEGPPAEKNDYSNPFYRYFLEIGEMEEVTLYYNYHKDEQFVLGISLYFIHYPDHYWQKAGNDPNEFWHFLNNNQLQPYSTVFTDTVNDLVAFFTEKLSQEPTISSEDSYPFDAPHQNYKSHTWTVDGEFHLSLKTYVDDTIDNNVKNTMQLNMVKL